MRQELNKSSSGQKAFSSGFRNDLCVFETKVKFLSKTACVCQQAVDSSNVDTLRRKFKFSKIVKLVENLKDLYRKFL